MPDDYLKLLEHSFAMEAQTSEGRDQSRLGYLAQHIFDFTTYESEADELFARKAVEVCAAITDSKTFDYIANPKGRIWYLLMVNMPFFMPRLNWGGSIRGAWWDHEQPVLDSCGLWVGQEQQTEWTFTLEEWEAFMRAVIAFAEPEMLAESTERTLS
ncbi:hypothetical protein [Acidovorax sp. SD340]|uniref:hypothetical protein n=1 Tax=Acidovorax sp. SD340 TaxID=1690268 RepID=UPI0006DCEF81|nr:hypothetical protein [Acidovorax sp. SD340]KQB59353.1 hypothetical protein AE621_10540 [Acidovorax sp. SD340]MBO1007108.1 hypothetical protein [Acidovorax sp. SD340]